MITMTQWLLIDLAVFLIVLTITGLIIPQILLVAFRKNLFDDIDPRKIHKGAIPRLGGIAFFPAIIFSMFLVFGCCQVYTFPLGTEILQSSLISFCFIISAIIILYLVGMADDLIGLKYRAKFIAQIFSSVLIIAGGIYIDNLHGFLWINSLNIGIAIVLSILLTVFITNAINLIDGIDGLASGLSSIACAFYGYYFYVTHLHLYSMLAFATLGSLIPFFYYNVFGNAQKHSKIFMGDTGALTIGLILSVLSIRICQIDEPVCNVNPAIAAFAPLLIPCFDVVRVYLHRIRSHRNPFLPDKTHIHHKLLALGMSQRIAMPTILICSVVLTVFNYLMSPFINISLLFLVDLLIWVIANTLLSRAIRRRQKETGIELYN